MRWRSAASSGLVSLTLLAAAASAEGATVEMGAVSQVSAGQPPTAGSNIFSFAVQHYVNNPPPPGFGPYEVPAGYGVLTQWSYAAGNVGGGLTLTMWRRPADYTAAANEFRTVVPNTINRFATRIPVSPGDRLGLGSESGTIPLGFGTNGIPPGNDLRQLVDHAVGDPQGTGGKRPDYLLSVAARVETDGDGDGFGDDTQDLCPTRADLQTACPSDESGPGGRGKDRERPRVGRPRLSATVFRAASSGRAIATGGRTTPVGTSVTFAASEAGSVRFRVQRRATGRKVGRKCKAPTRRNRKRRKCIRYVTASGSFSVNATPGTNTFRFRGRIGGRKLRPGRYRLTGKATDRAGNVSSVPARAFRIVR